MTMNKKIIVEMNQKFGKDWEKNIVCEGCGYRPTACRCNRQELIDILFVIGEALIVSATIIYIWLK